MRMIAIVVLGLLAAAPAFAQAPWENQQPAPGAYIPGVPGVPGAPGVPYPGAPYGYRSEAWRAREIENERRAHARSVQHVRAEEAVTRGAPRKDPFAADGPASPPASSSAALRGRAKASAATPAAPAPAPAAGSCATKKSCAKR